MKFFIKKIDLKQEINANVIIGAYQKKILSCSGNIINNISSGYITTILSKNNFTGEIGESLFLHDVPNFFSKNLLIIGCGKNQKIKKEEYEQIIYQSINKSHLSPFNKLVHCLNELDVIEFNEYWKIRLIIKIIYEKSYTFYKFKTQNKKQKFKINEIFFNLTKEDKFNISEKAIQHGIEISNSIKIAKDLANTPPNICSPTYLSNKFQELKKNNNKITATIINEYEMQKLGMNAYLSVGKGSKNETLMSIINYKGNTKQQNKPIVFIGKGVTFDSGGISVKPSYRLDEMKFDMCGAACVYAILKIAINLKLPLNIIGIIGVCENMINDRSLRPGDILFSLSGKTIEVINTDAEGRLILCDILTYVERLNPEVVIDIATLTGSCIIALGHHYTALMSNYQPLANELIAASEQSGDLVWQLPLTDKFQKQLNSECADMTNVGGKSAGTITAGCFLARFAKKYNWAHLDIAGSAWLSEPKKSPTGRPITLLSQFLINRAKSK